MAGGLPALKQDDVVYGLLTSPGLDAGLLRLTQTTGGVGKDVPLSLSLDPDFAFLRSQGFSRLESKSLGRAFCFDGTRRHPLRSYDRRLHGAGRCDSNRLGTNSTISPLSCTRAWYFRGGAGFDQAIVRHSCISQLRVARLSGADKQHASRPSASWRPSSRLSSASPSPAIDLQAPTGVGAKPRSVQSTARFVASCTSFAAQATGVLQIQCPWPRPEHFAWIFRI